MLIGIDLGTTNSLVACFRNGKAEIIPNRLGSHLTPSVISVTPSGNERLVMMFFVSKSKKIRKYLDEKTAMGTTTVFDELLHDYLSGKLKTELTALGLKKVEIHVDWLDDYRCIGVQAIHHKNYLDLQIEPVSFSVGYDPDEPDEHDSYPLEGKEQLYNVLKQILEE